MHKVLLSYKRSADGTNSLGQMTARESLDTTELRHQLTELHDKLNHIDKVNYTPLPRRDARYRGKDRYEPLGRAHIAKRQSYCRRIANNLCSVAGDALFACADKVFQKACEAVGLPCENKVVTATFRGPVNSVVKGLGDLVSIIKRALWKFARRHPQLAVFLTCFLYVASSGGLQNAIVRYAWKEVLRHVLKAYFPASAPFLDVLW
jgi:hypothetical protein